MQAGRLLIVLTLLASTSSSFEAATAHSFFCRELTSFRVRETIINLPDNTSPQFQGLVLRSAVLVLQHILCVCKDDWDSGPVSMPFAPIFHLLSATDKR